MIQAIAGEDDAKGQVETVANGNGAVTEYEYDDAERLKTIRHKASDTGPVLLQLAYGYNPRGLIETMTESGGDGSAAVAFDYDPRGRLISEIRETTHAYMLEYEYDAGGNRTRKARRDVTTWALLEETVYHYDLENPTLYQTKNNRLMYYEVFDDAGLLRQRVEYEYETTDSAVGNPTLIVRKVWPDGQPAIYYGTELVYNQSGELWFLIQTTWPDDGSGCSNHEVLSIHEFRSVGRAMRMTMQRDANDDPQNLNYLRVIDATRRWFDYDGDTIYADVAIGFEPETNAIVATELKAHEPGVGFIDRTSSDAAAYHHGDQIDSARLLTDDSAAVGRRLVYTAFGEPVYSDGTLATRHQYAGAWGYESDLYPPADGNSVPFIHVGHRWYDSSSGRFLQRDPIGIFGGPNIYEYASSTPTITVDPNGLDRWYVDTGRLGHHHVIVQNPDGRFNNAPFLRIDFYGIEGSGWIWD